MKSASSIAFSYIRFSSGEQKRGDSVRRQSALADAWSAKHKIPLDTSISLRDLGKSAFRGTHRTNPDRNALAGFLKLVTDGKIPRGSYLVIESLDRLTREHIRPALTLLLNLIESGIRVVQLTPVETIYDDKVEPMNLMMAIMELSRAHGESKRKSELSTAAWGHKKDNGSVKVLTRKTPGWIKCVGGEGREIKHTAPGEVRFALISESATTIRRIFKLALTRGLYRIAKQFNAEKVPVIGPTERKGKRVVWSVVSIAHIIHSPSVFGQYTPHRGRGPDRKPCGDPVENYFPAVISRDAWYATQNAITLRKQSGRGRGGHNVNLFSGLLRDWSDGSAIYYRQISQRRDRMWSLVSTAVKHAKKESGTSFPAEPFESAVVAGLSEIKPRDLATDDTDAPNRLDAIDGKLTELDALVERWRAKMDDPNIIDTVAGKLTELAATRKELMTERGVVEREASAPIGDAWKEFVSLADVVASDGSDETKLKIRSALRRAIKHIDCLFLPPIGRQRLAIVRVTFNNEKFVRVFFVHVTPPAGGGNMQTKPGQWRCASHREHELPRPFYNGGPPITDPKMKFTADDAFTKRFLAVVNDKTATHGTIE